MSAMKAKLNWPKEDVGALVPDADWDGKSVSDLAKLLADGLHTCLCNAIKKIAESGYSEQVAEKVVLRCGPFYGTKDMVSLIVDRALACLRNENKGCPDLTFYTFEDLKKLAEYMSLEMVTMLREIKPSLSVHDAIWTMLICDLNLVHASEAEIDPLKFSIGGGNAVQEEGTSAETPSQSEFQHQEIIISNLNKPDMLKPSKTNPESSKSGKRMEEKCASCRKCCSVNAHKRDSLRQKPFHFEKPHKGRMSKGALKAKLATWGDLALDKKQSPSNSSSVNKKNPTLAVKDTESVPASVSVAVSASPAPPQEKAKLTSKPETVPPQPPKTADYYLASIPYDELKGEHVPRDDKDKMILAAVARVQSLQKELQSWDDWANVKVMQVAKRLSHDRPELKTLKAEKEEAERLQKDKQVMEEGTMKRLSEVTAALNTANGQIEMANSAVVRLESEKSVIGREMETATSRSSLEAKSLEQALRKEQEALKKSQSFGSEKNLLEEDLKALKRQMPPRQRDLEKAKGLLTQAETRLANEERETAKFLKQAESIRNEREHLEALAKAEDEITTKKAEEEFKRYENEMKRIQYEISAMKLEAETKKIAAMRKGMNWQPSKGTKRSEVLGNNFKHGNMSQKKDRECVMCLTEEMTVVFLPCGHQVLCADCNVIHEKNGMKECPSCRTPIQKRFAARFAKV